MNTKQKMAALLALHSIEATQVEGDMVYEVWEDGEVTLTKCGSLYGQRHLHTLCPGDVAVALPFEGFPLRNTKHGRIACKSEAGAKAAVTIIRGPAPFTSGQWFV